MEYLVYPVMSALTSEFFFYPHVLATSQAECLLRCREELFFIFFLVCLTSGQQKNNCEDLWCLI